MTLGPLMGNAELTQTVASDEEAGLGVLSTPKGYLPLKTMDVQAKITGLVSHVTVSQTFVNTCEQPLEATYILPLPSRAAITRFCMQVNGRVIDGVIKERGAARDEYDRAIAAGHRAAITEEERSGVFTVRVGNIMPGEEALVRLTLCGPLSYADGEATFRFPLVVAPRYIPGTPLPGVSVGDGVATDTDLVPDASRISPPVLLPGFPNPVQLRLEVELDPLHMPLAAVRASLHTTVDLAGNGQVRRLRLLAGERLNRDFILRFQLGTAAVSTALAVQDDTQHASAEGTWQLTLVPAVAQSEALKPRAIVFLLDRSGSMSGWKIVAARRAVARMVDTLQATDRFAVYAFSSQVSKPESFANQALMLATDQNRLCALEFLTGLDGRGGTEMALPLRQAVELLASRDSEHERILVLVTDGQVGNEDHLLRQLETRLRQVRVFALGIDRAVNEGFLDRLTVLGAGACELVESEERLDEAMARIHRSISSPVLTGLRLEAEGLELIPETIAPAHLPDLFVGVPLVVSGRYRQGQQPARLTLTAVDANGGVWSETLLPRHANNNALGVLWARGHIRDLEDRYVLGHGERCALEQRIVETSLRFRVLSRFTAFVAVDRAHQVTVAGTMHRVTQAVDLPHGWAMCPEATLYQALRIQAQPAQAVIRSDTTLRLARRLDSPAWGVATPGHNEARLGETVSAGTTRQLSWDDLLGQVRDRVSRSDHEHAPATPVPDLSSYRLWARALAESLDAYPRSRLVIELETLITHLEASGVEPREITPLRDVLVALRAYLADTAKPAAILQRLKEVLSAFAQGSTLPPPAPSAFERRQFWK